MSDGPRRPPKRRSRVPSGRVERLARFGWMAGELAAGSLAEGARRALRGGAGEAASAILSGANAKKLARRLSSMRGAAMKLGQLLSLETDDILPAEFVEALAVLRDAADTMPETQVRRVLGRAYGKGWEERFRRFDMDPIASASIGQVHEAVAVDGRELALKIQYPGVARSIESDVNNVAALLRLSRLLPGGLDVSGIVAEAKRQLRQEADYLTESENLRRYRELVADEPRLVVPRVHADLTTKRVLAMDRMRGLPIEDLAARGTDQARRDEAGRMLEHLVLRELFEFHFMQTDPNFANYLVDPADDRILLLDFGSTRDFEPAFAARYADLCRAVIDGDRPAVHRAAAAIGYVGSDETEHRSEGLVDLILLVCEPFRNRGPYDFAHSNLAARARDIGLDLMFRRGFLHPPPPETVFLHRKLVGSFLLCARIRARVDMRALLEPFLDSGVEP
ncbi:MAG: AarF/ABC1/UbiB kinase family protein [Deltaproteobacteria bacterium]|nr:AarF/ABC1/UbiB kinase family protein [Deltaproteobacteria bacterium]